MNDHYIDVFYADDRECPYQVFVFEQGIITGQCDFAYLLPVAQFCRIHELPVLSASEAVRTGLSSYDINVQPLRSLALNE